jgi:ATP/maltotriose-dependent transcriptional regulator MalT
VPLAPDVVQRRLAQEARKAGALGGGIGVAFVAATVASEAGGHTPVLTLLERGSQWLHLVVASRTRPAWPLARLKSQGLVYELGAGDLTLSQAETAHIFGADLGEPALASLHQQTEGWAVAVQLL